MKFVVRSQLSLEFDVNPIGKARARFSRMNGRFFTPKKTEDWERLVKSLARQQVRGKGLNMTAPVYLDIDAYFAPMPTWPKWKKAAAMLGLISNTSKPDVDNVAKALLDALNGIVYADDQYIVGFRIMKHFAEKGHISVSVSSMATAHSGVKRREEYETLIESFKDQAANDSEVDDIIEVA